MANDKGLLDGEEYAAIREAIAGTHSAKREYAQQTSLDAQPIALIAEDRAAERAVPDGQRLLERWVPEIRHVIGRLFGKDIDVTISTAEIVDESALKRMLSNCWMTRIDVTGRRGVCILITSGPLLEAAAVQRFGGEAVSVGMGRNPSQTVLSLFTPLGQALTRTLAECWKEVQGCVLTFAEDDVALERARRTLERTKITVLLELQVKGVVDGTIRLLASPEILAAPPRQLEAIPAEPGQIERALGEVDVQVRVELGKTKIKLASFTDLTPGTVLTLHAFVGDLLPVRCQGVMIGYGRAVLSRGTMAVEMSTSK